MKTGFNTNDFIPAWGSWSYTGDINLDEGATFFKTEDIRLNGYADCVSVINMCEATGDFEQGFYTLEFGTVNLESDKKKTAYETIGLDTSKRQSKYNMFDAYFAYGLRDVHSIRNYFLVENDSSEEFKKEKQAYYSDHNVEVVTLDEFKEILENMDNVFNFI